MREPEDAASVQAAVEPGSPFPCTGARLRPTPAECAAFLSGLATQNLTHLGKEGGAAVGALFDPKKRSETPRLVLDTRAANCRLVGPKEVMTQIDINNALHRIPLAEGMDAMFISPASAPRHSSCMRSTVASRSLEGAGGGRICRQCRHVGGAGLRH